MGVHMEYKICPSCKVSFELTSLNFYLSKNYKSGFGTYCKKCTMQQNNKTRIKWRENNQEEYKRKNKEYTTRTHEHRLEYNKSYREEHREELRIKSSEYYSNNKTECNLRSLSWQRNNKDTWNAYRNKVKLETPEVLSKYAQKYYETHKQECSERNKKWASENRDRIRQHRRKRESLKRQLKSTLTFEQWELAKSVFENKCCYCGKETKLTQDHFIPISKGGEYTERNIVPACPKCNCSKGVSNLSDWYPKYKYYSKEREAKILDYLKLNI